MSTEDNNIIKKKRSEIETNMSAAPPLSSLTRLNSTLKDLFIYIYDLSPLDLDLLFLLIKKLDPRL